MKTVVIVSILALTTGCASITRGTTEAYVIETTPPGAAASLSNGLSCKTPCSVNVKRRGDFVVTIAREGYETVSASVTSSVDGAGAAGMAGNVLLGGIIGAGIDAGTGAMHSHKPNPLTVTMVSVDVAPGTASTINTESKANENDPVATEQNASFDDKSANNTASDSDADDGHPPDDAAVADAAGSK